MGFPNRQTFDAINLCSNNNTIQKNTINEAFAGILEGSGRQHLQSVTFFNVTYVRLAGDSCPPIDRAIRQSRAVRTIW